MKTVCHVSRIMPDGLPGASVAGRHRAVCLWCQADDARARTLLRELAALRDEVLVAPAWVHARAMARLGAQTGNQRGRSPRIRRVVGGTVAAAAIGTAALFGELARRRARATG